MKLWMTGFYIGEISLEQANNLRENIGKVVGAEKYVIAVDTDEQMIIVEKEQEQTDE